MAWLASRDALRSVARNARRSALSVVGIAIGCILALVMESLNRGKTELFARVGASSGIGHVRVVPAGWRTRHDPQLRLGDWEADIAAARSLPGVVVVTARTRGQVLLAVGTHVVPVEMVGVDPAVEPRMFRYVEHVQDGRYLRAGEPGTLVVGQVIADQLTAGVDDEVVATAVGPGGEIQSALLRIVGVVRTGSDEADAGVCQVLRGDVEQLTGRPGAGEVSLILADYRQAGVVRAQLASRIAHGDDVMTMTELAPEIEAHRAAGRRERAAGGRAGASP
jgi:ABC-type lipoprotein release transport system permease subunit